MIDRIDEIIELTYKYYQFNLSELISNVFKNNKRLLYDTKIVEKMMIKILMIIDEIKEVNEMKIDYLSVMKVFMEYQNLSLKKNKLILMVNLGS